MSLSRIELNWTPNPNAITQKVQRSLSSSGPWSTIATLGPTVSTYLDSNVTSNPHTDYYYRIETTCSSGTDYSSVITEEARCCPTNNKGNIFGVKATSTDAYNQGPLVTYTDRASSFVRDNATAYPNPVVSTIADDYETLQSGLVTTNTPTLICPECSTSFTETQPYIPETNTLSSGASADWSLMSKQKHITQYLPNAYSALGGSANAGMGNVFRKYNAQNGYVIAGRFELGIGGHPTSSYIPWAGGPIKLNAAGTEFVNLPVSQYNINDYPWEMGRMPVLNSSGNVAYHHYPQQLRISRYGFNNTTFNSIYDNNAYTNSTTYDQGSTLNNLVGSIPAGQSESNWYISIIDAEDPDMYYPNTQSYNSRPWICYHRMYKITRNTSWDLYDVNNNLIAYGYRIQAQGQTVYNNKRILGFPLNGTFRRYAWGQQPTCILKIFQM